MMCYSSFLIYHWLLLFGLIIFELLANDWNVIKNFTLVVMSLQISVLTITHKPFSTVNLRTLLPILVGNTFFPYLFSLNDSENMVHF